jgi:hypothetical protein
VAVALVRSRPGEAGVELSRINVESVPLVGAVTARIPWKAAAGTHQLKVRVDPDNTVNDANRTNNEAMISLTVPGEDAKPTVKVTSPADGATLAGAACGLTAEATDDSGVEAVHARIDGGLWQPVGRAERQDAFAARCLLQPGKHQITVLATDSGGNQVEQTVKVTVEAETPTVQITGPAAGASIDARRTAVTLRCDKGTAVAAVRVNGGVWQRVALKDAEGTADVTLPFGQVALEAMAANARGVVALAKCPVNCTRQPDPQSPAEPQPPPESGALDIEGLGRVDLFGPPNVVVPAPAVRVPKP